MTGVQRAREREAKAAEFRDALYSRTPKFVQERPEKRREFKASSAFDHGSASAAALRHKAARKGKPRRPRKPFEKRPYDPIDHVHPRHKREWLRLRANEAA